MDATDTSFAYNAVNSAYFSVRGLCPVENQTLEQLLEEKGTGNLPNIIVS